MDIPLSYANGRVACLQTESVSGFRPRSSSPGVVTHPGKVNGRANRGCFATVKSGKKVGEACRALRIDETSCFALKKQYVGLGLTELPELRRLFFAAREDRSESPQLIEKARLS